MHISLPTTLNRMIISRPEAKTGVCLVREQMLRKSERTVASIPMRSLRAHSSHTRSHIEGVARNPVEISFAASDAGYPSLSPGSFEIPVETVETAPWPPGP